MKRETKRILVVEVKRRASVFSRLNVGQLLSFISEKKSFGKSIEDHELISLACVSSETYNLQRVFRRVLYRNGGSLCQAFLKENVETGTKNRCVIKAMHVLRRKLKKD